MSLPHATVQATGVHKRFGRTRALTDVSLCLYPGVTGLLGPNGAGKTTLLRLLATVISPDAGRLRMLGVDPADPKMRIRIRQQIGYLPQEPCFHPNFTAFEFVDYVAILKEHHDRRARHREVLRVLEAVDLGAVAGKQIRKLSAGMRQRVALAQALLGDPRLLILDEPAARLDLEQRLSLRDLISRLGEDRTIILSTHHIERAGSLCHRIMIMRAGTTLWSGTPTALTESARGKVWLSDRRNLGDAPDGAQLVAPTIEDGYLLILHEQAPETRP
jgi:ABC-2 type transport system ATP-binding protein